MDYLPALMFHVDGKFQVLESFVKDEFDKHQIEQVCFCLVFDGDPTIVILICVCLYILHS